MRVVKVKSAKDVVWDALCRSADKKGRTSETVNSLSRLLVNKDGQATTGAIGDHATAHLLYSLQKSGLITFKEVGVNTSHKGLVDIRLTPRGMSECRKHRLSVVEYENNYQGLDNS